MEAEKIPAWVRETMGCGYTLSGMDTKARTAATPVDGTPTPTTYARFGRFGSPYAALDLTMIDPALVEFDRRTTGIDQFRENLQASVPNTKGGQEFVNAFLDSYRKKFNPDDATTQYAGIYDKHFSEDDIKGLLQFYGSALGRKYAAEMPKINAEVQAANRGAGTRIAKEVLQDLRRRYPEIGAQARLVKQRTRHVE